MVLGWLLLGRYFTTEEETSSVSCRSGNPLHLSISVIACVSLFVDLVYSGGGGGAGCFLLDVFGI
jgi:hypothetical protein